MFRVFIGVGLGFGSKLAEGFLLCSSFGSGLFRFSLKSSWHSSLGLSKLG